MTHPTPWTTNTPTRSPFALPMGLPGRVAGRLMRRLNRQEDLLDLLDIGPGDRVLEVGHGPGALLRRLRWTSAERICGVDPSPDMRRLAARPHRAEIRVGRVELRQGTAEDTGFSDGEFHWVVSVNTVAFWPDLDAGLRELHRVTRPGGRVLIAWHGGTHPSRIARRLALPEETFTRVEHGMRERFTAVTRHELSALTVLSATR